MGFWRSVGYLFSILIIVGGLFLIFANPIIGIIPIVLGIIFIWALRKSGQVASMQKDLKYMADSERGRVKGTADGEREKDEEERREEQRLKDEIKKLEDKKKQLEKEKGD
jgi:uncharacterized membrane protein